MPPDTPGGDTFQVNVDAVSSHHQNLVTLKDEGVDLHTTLNRIVFQDLPEIWKSQSKSQADQMAEETIQQQLPRIWSACESLATALGQTIQSTQHV